MKKSRKGLKGGKNMLEAAQSLPAQPVPNKKHLRQKWSLEETGTKPSLSYVYDVVVFKPNLYKKLYGFLKPLAIAPLNL
uniref:SFRICE_024775 n=1 Tax=Spodoptera frugiperda TaxID=7108 RepID=A0A2H1VJD3_SPOFR